MKNKVLSIITSMIMVAMSLPDIDAMSYRDKGMSRSAIVKTVGGITAGVAGAGLIAYGMMKGWNYYQELVANKVYEKVQKEIDEKLCNEGVKSIQLDRNKVHEKICTYYGEVCAELMYGYLSSFFGKLSDMDVIGLVESKLKCYYNYNISAEDYVEVVVLSHKLSTEESGSIINVAVITIPEGSECIGDYACQYYTKLKSVKIPKSVTRIGKCAFSCCTNLESIEIPEGVTSIGEGAFWNCTKLKSVEIPKSVTSIGDNAFSYCTNLESIEISEGVKSIGDGAFCDCTKLKSVKIPKSVTSIGNGAFSNCTNLESIEISENVTSIGYNAFGYCTNLESIKIPEGVTSIGEYAFCCCKNLRSIILPESIKTVGEYAFLDCPITNVNDGQYHSVEEFLKAIEK